MSEALTDHGGIQLKDISVVIPDGGTISGYESGITGLEYGVIDSMGTASGAGAALETRALSSDSGGGGWLASLGFPLTPEEAVMLTVPAAEVAAAAEVAEVSTSVSD